MNKDIELKILNACFNAFPHACVVKVHLVEEAGIPLDVLDKEIIYLVGHGLIECVIEHQGRDKRYIFDSEPVFITSKGIDFLQRNGGLTRMMNFHFALKR